MEATPNERSEQDVLRPRAAVRHLHHAEERPAAGGRAPGRTLRGIRLRPRDVPGPPVPAGVPRHADAAHVGRGAHRAHPPLGERREPAAAAAGRARTCGREPRPALGRPVRARTRSRRLLGRDRRDGRAAPHSGPGGRRALRGHRHHSRHLEPGGAGAVRGRRRVLPGQRREARAGAGAQHPHLAGGLQASHASAHGPQGRRVAAVARIHEAGPVRRVERDDR
ncbi:hypothetical protein QFZ26_001681 [Agromyces ramosus]|uniref:Uncharacterized protein n=1 Tax=Agromyces ramosus TaxID=33879 RepID=A0ABU0R7Q5_9MICO|nr:hypothetical protein [Agromyces ramosus]